MTKGNIRANIRPMKDSDFDRVVYLNIKCFPTDNSSLSLAEQWIRNNFNAYPMNKYYVAETDDVNGYILWREAGGFRKDAVLELAQIGVDPEMWGRKIASQLVEYSIKDVFQKHIVEAGKNLDPALADRSLHAVMVTTGNENSAQRLYQNKLGAQFESTISNLYTNERGHQELVMLARPKQLESVLNQSFNADKYRNHSSKP